MIEGWRRVSVGDIGKIVSGGTPDSTNPAYWDGDIPWATQTDITNLTSRYISSTARRITESGLKSSSAKLVPPGSILVCTRATIGELAIASEPVCTNQGFKNLITNPEYDNEFVFYLLSFFKNILVRYASGSTFLELTKRDFERLTFTVPPFSEQRKIAKILSTWDCAIETIKEIIANGQTQKKILMRKLLSGKCRFPEIKGRWIQKPLNQICNVSKGVQLNKSGLSDEDQFPVINGGIMPSGYTSSFNRNANTITISEGGESCGFVNLLKVRFWCGGHCYSLEDIKISRDLLFQILKLNERKIMRLRVGSGLPNIQKRDLEQLTILFPEDSEEQEKISVVLSAFDNKVESLQKKYNCLKRERDALIRQLLTGEHRV